MIFLFHGDDLLRSRLAFEQVKAAHQDAETLTFEGKKISLTELKEVMETGSLFGRSRLIVIENLLSSKKGVSLQEIVSYLQLKRANIDLVLYENETLNKTLLSKLPDAKVELFKHEPVMFKLLEALRPNNVRQTIELWQLTCRSESPEIIFFMMVRHLRLLLLIKEGVEEGVDEIVRLAPWQKERLTKQSGYFTLEQLVKLYHELLDIDHRQKSGEAPFALGKTLELFLINL